MGSTDEVNEHEAGLKSMLSKMGYDPHPISEGLAVVYGEMESSNYTGIGISCGGGLCNVCLAYLSVPVFSFSIPKAGDFIDASAAQLRGEPATRIRTIKEESFHFNGHFVNKIHQALSTSYEDMIQALVAALKDQFASVQNMPKLNRPIPLVFERRQRDAAWLPGPVREMPARNRTPGSHRRSSHGVQSHGFHRARGVGGGAERVVELPRRAVQ